MEGSGASLQAAHVVLSLGGTQVTRNAPAPAASTVPMAAQQVTDSASQEHLVYPSTEAPQDIDPPWK